MDALRAPTDRRPRASASTPGWGKEAILLASGSGRENASDEVTLFLDGGDLCVTGEAGTIDLVLAEVLGPDDSRRRRSATRLAGAGAVGATAAAARAATEELLQPTRAAWRSSESLVHNWMAAVLFVLTSVMAASAWG